MFHLKGCPKCRGDLELSSDRYGSFERCLQCGYVKDIPETTATASWLGPDSTRRHLSGKRKLPQGMVSKRK